MLAKLRLNNISALQLFQLLRFSAFFITGMGLAKSGLTLGEIGAFETLLFISGILSFFWINGLLNTFLTTYDKTADTDQQGLQLFNIFLLLIAGSAIVFAILRVFEGQITSLFSNSLQILHFKLFTWYILLNNPLFLIEYLYLLKNKPKHSTLYGILNFIGIVSAVLLPLYTGYTINESIYALIFLSLVKFLWLLYLMSVHSKAKLSVKELSVISTLALPLILSMLMSGSAEYIDQWMVSKFLGKEQLAIFRYGAKELPFSLILANALSVAIIPYLRENKISSASLKELKTKTLRLMHILFPITLVLMLLSEQLYPILFSQAFVASAGIFNIYLLLITSRMLFPQTILLANQDTSSIFRISIIEITVNIVISYILLQKIGLIGIAWGTVIAFALEKILLIFRASSKHQIHPDQYIPWKVLLLYSILLFSCYFLLDLFY